MLHVTKKDENEFAAWLKKQHARAAQRLEGWGIPPEQFLATEVGWLMILGKYEGRMIDLDNYQIRFMSIKAKRRSLLKARQIGFSWEIACESLARCHIKRKHTAVCVSYNLDDAKEKISLAKEIHEELPLAYQKYMSIDSKTEVGFRSNDARRQVSRIISYPSKAPRGKTGDVYLDELAHCQNDKAIYAGATALISRSGGQLTIGSTPLGRRGMFHAIHTQEFEDFPGFWRQEIPWWLCRHFCVNVAEAGYEAPTMATADRVAKYGTPSLIDQFNALPLEDFQQEFELAFQDERVSFFPFELILPCCKRDRQQIPVYETLEDLERNLGGMERLYAGFDVGRTKHPSELVIFEERKGLMIMRYQEQFKNMKFPDQRERLTKILKTIRPRLEKFRIDATGLGRNLAEDLEKSRDFGKKVESVQFSAPKKSELANSLKIALEEKSIVLPRDRDLISQIHSIKQKITSSGNTIFDAEKNRHHHADKMWAITLATLKKRERKKVLPRAGVRMLGEKKGEQKPKVKKTDRGTDTTGVFDNLFTDVSTEREKRQRLEAAKGRLRAAMVSKFADTKALEKKAESLKIAAGVWERSGDKEQAAAIMKQHRRLMLQIKARRQPTQS